MKTVVHEIAPDLFRLSLYFGKADLQFNHFLFLDEEPLLYHAGLRSFFPLVRKGVAEVMDPARLRWIGFSHFEADECGALNEWLETAPGALPVCGVIAAAINISDHADRRPRVLADGEVLTTGRRRFRLLETPQVPHGWDASLLFEETGKILLCSDLFLHQGNVEAVFDGDLLERARETHRRFEGGPLHGAFPATPLAPPTLERLAGLDPKGLALMHGSYYTGDCRTALQGLAGALGLTP